MKPSSIFYEKRKNKELFESFQEYGLEKTQNYIPIYNKFFLLNETNYNHVNLNHPYYITKINKELELNIFDCTIEKNQEQTNQQSNRLNKPIFFKLAPLLDPFKSMVGKYHLHNKDLLTLPTPFPEPVSPEDAKYITHYDIKGKIYDENNCAYVDSLFSFLSSQLLHNHRFLHGLDYYGSFLTIKKDFKLNIYDDIDYLTKSEYFNKHKNVLFQVEDYSHLITDDDASEKKPPITIFDSKDNDIDIDVPELDLGLDFDFKSEKNIETVTEDNLREMEWKNDLWEKNADSQEREKSNSKSNSNSNALSKTTLKSGSSCSSRTSYTNSNKEDDDSDADSHSTCSTCMSGGHTSTGTGTDTGTDTDSNGDTNSSYETEDDTPVYATLPAFPVQIICLEKCENTLDDFIQTNEDIKDIEWFSALFQIIMTLLAYQKVYSFTHNDLHTNNVMYVKTNKQFLYYCYKNNYYRVPTFGRLFKIIDFGRGIYRVGEKLCCSNSFENGEDAHTQYNTEPYFNDKKPRIEPNYSFDLCRLACSIFDYVVEDMDSINTPGKLKRCDAITRLIVEWCLDDNGVNVLYKNDGSERYPDFKLYKMIARNVHKHTPDAQLERKEFKAFLIQKKKISASDREDIMDLDKM